MAFNNLCTPALLYLLFSLTQIVIDTVKGLYNTALVKIFVTFVFTIMLNSLCNQGLGVISWIIVFIPFILMTVIVAVLLLMFGLDPGKHFESTELANNREERKHKNITGAHLFCAGNRPSTTLLYSKLTPKILGKVLALFEHRTFVEGLIWNLNSFDQWGVELGKGLARELSGSIKGNEDLRTFSSSTLGLVREIKRLKN